MLTKLIMTLCLPLPALYASPSLFFTKEEIYLIHHSMDKNTEESSPILHLSAIIYVNKDHWTLWLNNRLIRPHQPLHIKGFAIEEVTPNNVRFSWLSPTSSLPVQFTLRPNQRLLINEKRVEPK